MRNNLKVRFEYDPKYEQEIWVYDNIHGHELGKIISMNELGSYMNFLIKLAADFNNDGASFRHAA